MHGTYNKIKDLLLFRAAHTIKCHHFTAHSRLQKRGFAMSQINTASNV